MSHNLIRGKSGTIEIQTGPEPAIKRSKSGSLLVVSVVNEIFSRKQFFSTVFILFLDCWTIERKGDLKREELQCCALI